MAFWDSSAIVPLLTREPATATVQLLLRGDDHMAVWWTTRVECISALFRRHREGGLDTQGVLSARLALDTLASGWTEVLPTQAVRIAAERLLGAHAIRAADALQLGAATALRGSPPGALTFVCLDRRLREAAMKDGFTVRPPE